MCLAATLILFIWSFFDFAKNDESRKIVHREKPLFLSFFISIILLLSALTRINHEAHIAAFLLITPAVTLICCLLPQEKLFSKIIAGTIPLALIAITVGILLKPADKTAAKETNDREYTAAVINSLSALQGSQRDEFTEKLNGLIQQKKETKAVTSAEFLELSNASLSAGETVSAEKIVVNIDKKKKESKERNDNFVYITKNFLSFWFTIFSLTAACIIIVLAPFYTITRMCRGDLFRTFMTIAVFAAMALAAVCSTRISYEQRVFKSLDLLNSTLQSSDSAKAYTALENFISNRYNHPDSLHSCLKKEIRKNILKK
jgi:hypothetical protein